MVQVIIGTDSLIVSVVSLSNGVVYIIDSVLESDDLPPPVPILEVISHSEVLTFFYDQVVQGGLASILNGTGNYTVFAPTDQAAPKLASTLGISIGQPISGSILELHVVEDIIPFSELQELQSIDTMGGTVQVAIHFSVYMFLIVSFTRKPL